MNQTLQDILQKIEHLENCVVLYDWGATTVLDELQEYVEAKIKSFEDVQ